MDGYVERMASPTTRTERIAIRVNAAMEAQGVTLYQLADRANLPRTTLRYRVAGTAKWTLDQLYAVGEVLGFTPAEILREVDQDAA